MLHNCRQPGFDGLGAITLADMLTAWREPTWDWHEAFSLPEFVQEIHSLDSITRKHHKK